MNKKKTVFENDFNITEEQMDSLARVLFRWSMTIWLPRKEQKMTQIIQMIRQNVRSAGQSNIFCEYSP